MYRRVASRARFSHSRHSGNDTGEIPVGFQATNEPRISTTDTSHKRGGCIIRPDARVCDGSSCLGVHMALYDIREGIVSWTRVSVSLTVSFLHSPVIIARICNRSSFTAHLRGIGATFSIGEINAESCSSLSLSLYRS